MALDRFSVVLVRSLRLELEYTKLNLQLCICEDLSLGQSWLVVVLCLS